MPAAHARASDIRRTSFPGAMLAAFVWIASALVSAQSAPGAGAGGALVLDPASGTARQTPSRSAGPAGRPAVTAVRAAQPPAVDGRLDDPIWRTAAHIDKFVQQRPLEGVPATEQTDVYIAYDSEKLYFGIYSHYSDRSLIRANRVDRDKTDEDDTVTVSFDPYFDQQLGYSFSVNGYGVQGDSVLKGGGGASSSGNTGSSGGGSSGAGATPTPTGSVGDTSWNALFTSAGQLVEDGWTAEVAIPFKSLRYPARGSGEAHRWGFQIEREIKTKNETDHWAPISRDVTGYLRQMGVLAGMANLSTSHNFELLPTFTAVQSGSLNKTTGAFTTSDVEEGGVNVKYGITSDITLDFTYNPDFSQIESDRQQIEVNQRFPVQYSELRPFFLEAVDIFRFQGPATIVHTRTIVDPLYGAKLTGKIGKTALGFLVANDEAPGKVEDSRDPAFNRTAQSFLARARYDFRSESFFGALYTDREFLDGHSRVFLTDVQLRLPRNHRAAPYVAFTDHVDAAGVRTRAKAIKADVRMEGRNWSYFIGHFTIDPDFKTDLGFIRRTDQRLMTGNVAYRWWPEGWIINWGPQFNYDRNYDYQGHLQAGGPGGQLNVQFAKNINATATVSHDIERYRDRDFTKNRLTISGRVNTSRRISFTGSINVGDEIRFIVNPFLGHTTVFAGSVIVRPFSRLQSTINLDTTKFTDVRTNTEAFDIKLLRAQTTYQFTPRLLVRNVMELNTFNKTLFANILMTYRVNSGTAFYLGYDDRYMQGDKVNAQLFPESGYQRTNRALFTKLQYLFRNNGGR